MKTLEELARMIRENPSLADALSLQERGDLIKAGVYQANLDSPYVQKILKQAERQDHLCSICGEKFEGPGHNAEPAARGRCCRSCDRHTVIPERERRLDAGYEYARLPGAGGMRDWSKPIGRTAPPVEEKDRGEAQEFPLVPHQARVDRAPQAVGAGKSPGFTDKLRRDPETHIRLPSMNDLVKARLVSDIPTTMERLMTEHFPDLMRKYYPRVYENVGRYHSPRQCAAFLANVTAESATLGPARMPTAYKLLLPSLEPMARRGMPMFFIAPDLLAAIQRTDFADDIDWTTLRLPYEQGIFILPKGAMTHREDGDVAMVAWARLREKTPYPAPIAGWPPTVLANTGFVLLGLCIQNGIWYDSTFNAKVRPTIRLHNLFYRTPGEHTPASVKSTNLDSDLNEYDEEFLEKLGVVAFGTFLAMNAKPELLEKGQLLKRVAKAGAPPREFWSPNIIGPRYRLKREVPRLDRYGQFAADQPKRGLGGAHASPRLHWRRGHFRNQPYGPGLKERKQIWIEPCLIGAEDAAQGARA